MLLETTTLQLQVGDADFKPSLRGWFYSYKEAGVTVRAEFALFFEPFTP